MFAKIYRSNCCKTIGFLTLYLWAFNPMENHRADGNTHFPQMLFTTGIISIWLWVILLIGTWWNRHKNTSECKYMGNILIIFQIFGLTTHSLMLRPNGMCSGCNPFQALKQYTIKLFAIGGNWSMGLYYISRPYTIKAGSATIFVHHVSMI